jgi:ubiquinone/menaquinone biosynthesis C-methylase UbiE
MTWRDFIFRPSPPVASPAGGEEARIRAVYAKRQAGTRYSWFNPGHLFMVQARERRLLALLAQYGSAPLQTKTLLEVGCGTGYWLREFIKWGARPENIAGIDLLADRIAEAARLCPTAVQLRCGSAAQLPFPDGAFDLVLQSTVFTSVLDPALKRRMASEMLRVLKEDGLILWYDYHVNNPRNPDVRGVTRREIDQLFPGCRIALRRLTLAPPLARLLAPYSWFACYVFEQIPLLCTHYVGVIQKGDAHASSLSGGTGSSGVKHNAG